MSFASLMGTILIAFDLISVKSNSPSFSVHFRMRSSRSCGVLQSTSSLQTYLRIAASATAGWPTRSSASRCKQLNISDGSNFSTDSPSSLGVGTATLSARIRAPAEAVKASVAPSISHSPKRRSRDATSSHRPTSFLTTLPVSAAAALGDRGGLSPMKQRRCNAGIVSIEGLQCARIRS
eukprot:2788530-Pleurochrysis_carterae.AAC.1